MMNTLDAVQLQAGGFHRPSFPASCPLSVPTRCQRVLISLSSLSGGWSGFNQQRGPL